MFTFCKRLNVIGKSKVFQNFDIFPSEVQEMWAQICIFDACIHNFLFNVLKTVESNTVHQIDITGKDYTIAWYSNKFYCIFLFLVWCGKECHLEWMENEYIINISLYHVYLKICFFFVEYSQIRKYCWINHWYYICCWIFTLYCCLC